MRATRQVTDTKLGSGTLKLSIQKPINFHRVTERRQRRNIEALRLLGRERDVRVSRLKSINRRNEIVNTSDQLLSIDLFERPS